MITIHKLCYRSNSSSKYELIIVKLEDMTNHMMGMKGRWENEKTANPTKTQAYLWNVQHFGGNWFPTNLNCFPTSLSLLFGRGGLRVRWVWWSFFPKLFFLTVKGHMTPSSLSSLSWVHPNFRSTPPPSLFLFLFNNFRMEIMNMHKRLLLLFFYPKSQIIWFILLYV